MAEFIGYPRDCLLVFYECSLGNSKDLMAVIF
jgi:hypothetical protein